MKNTTKIALNSAWWFVLALLFASIFASVSEKAYVTDLPAWRPDPNLWWVQILYWFPNFGRPVDGMDTFALCFMGTSCLFLIPIWDGLHGRPLPLSEWFEIFTDFIAIAVIEDRVWYAINPAWGSHRFRPENLPGWMYQAWFMGIPSQYWEACAGSLGTAVASVWLRDSKAKLSAILQKGILYWGIVWATMIIGVFVVSKIADRFWIR